MPKISFAFQRHFLRADCYQLIIKQEDRITISGWRHSATIMAFFGITTSSIPQSHKYTMYCISSIPSHTSIHCTFILYFIHISRLTQVCTLFHCISSISAALHKCTVFHCISSISARQLKNSLQLTT